MPPASRIGDMHVCLMVGPGPTPHVGGPVIVGAPTVITVGMPQARVGDQCVCAIPMDVIVKGSMTVMVNGKPAARIGDMTAHGGNLVVGAPTVIIGDAGGGGGGGGGGAGPGGGKAGGTITSDIAAGWVPLEYNNLPYQAKVLADAAITGAPFCEICAAAAAAANKTPKKPAKPDPFGAGNLKLGNNEIYRDAILAAAAKTGLPSQTVAAIINAEAALQKDGTWDTLSAAAASGARGLTQFIPSSWIMEAERRGSQLNAIAEQAGMLDTYGQVLAAKRDELLALRDDPATAILVGADYAMANIERLRQAGLVPDALDEADLAKLRELIAGVRG